MFSALGSLQGLNTPLSQFLQAALASCPMEETSCEHNTLALLNYSPFLATFFLSLWFGSMAPHAYHFRPASSHTALGSPRQNTVDAPEESVKIIPLMAGPGLTEGIQMEMVWLSDFLTPGPQF